MKGKKRAAVIAAVLAIAMAAEACWAKTANTTETASATTAKTTAETARLAKPTEVKATATGERTIALKWKVVSGAAKYVIEVKNTKTGKQRKIVLAKKKKSGTVTVKIGKLAYATKYAFRVTAVAGSRKSAASKTVYARTKLIIPAKPSAWVESKGEDSFTVKWNPVKYADEYAVYQDMGTWKAELQRSRTTSYSAEGLEAGTVDLIIRAVRRRGGASAYSERERLSMSVQGRYAKFANLASTVDDGSVYSGGGDPYRTISTEQAEAYVNYSNGGRPFGSPTDWLVWINTRSYRLFVFQWDGKYWQLDRSWPCVIGTESNPTQRGVFTLSRMAAYWDYGYNHSVYVTSYSGDNAIHSLLFPSESDSLTAGFMSSQGCVRLISSAAKYVYDNCEGANCVIY